MIYFRLIQHISYQLLESLRFVFGCAILQRSASMIEHIHLLVTLVGFQILN